MRDSERQKQRDRERERQTDRQTEREREREREREKEREREREREMFGPVIDFRLFLCIFLFPKEKNCQFMSWSVIFDNCLHDCSSAEYDIATLLNISEGLAKLFIRIIRQYFMALKRLFFI